jgi:putative ABC transport system permease protein
VIGDRVRDALLTVSSAPWRRAPLLLRRRLGVVATVAGACAVLTASVAAVPLFLSSVGTGSVALQAAERCPRDTGAVLRLFSTPQGVRTPAADPFLPVADDLGPSNRWDQLEFLRLEAQGSPGTPATLLVRDGALEHVEVLATSGGDGVWIPDRAAERTGLAVGDLASIGTAEVPVAGIYRDVAGPTLDDYWCTNADLYLLQAGGADLVLPPPVVIVDRETFADLMGAVDADRAEGAWQAPLRPGLTVADARALLARLACTAEQEPSLPWCFGGQPALPGGRRGETPVRAEDDAHFVESFLQSHLPFLIERSEAIQTSVGGGIWPVAGFAALAGMGLVAAAASLWFDRRRRELTLLTVRGVSPAGLGLKAGLELAVPCLIGALAGVGLADAMVVSLGPSSVVEPSALRGAALAGLASLVAAELTVGLVVAARVRAHQPRPPRRLRVVALPWEAVLVWLAVVSYRRLGEWGVPVGRGAEVTRVDVLGLLFPVLFLVSTVAVLSRLLGLALPPLRAASRTWPMALYLTIRRVARYRAAVTGLVAAAALAAGVLGYAATMDRSLDATLQAKAATFVGSATAVQLDPGATLPAELEDHATDVMIHQDAWIDDGGRRSAMVLAVDPATFAQGAFWDATFAADSLRTLLDHLAAPPVAGRVPAIVVGADGGIDHPVEVSIRQGATHRIELAPLSGVDAFPGMSRPELTVVVAASALQDLELTTGRPEAWIAGDHDHTVDVLRASGTGFDERRAAGAVVDGAAFLTVSWTFGFMKSLGLSAGVLVVGAVAVYLDARRRDRLLGYAFMRRMGLRAPQHRRALGAELVASVAVGCWMGLGLSFLAAWLAHQRIDPVPGFRPDPVLRPASVVMTVIAAVALALVALAAGLAQRRVDRDDPVEVLRAGV